jgi:HEAT repeat protein
LTKTLGGTNRDARAAAAYALGQIGGLAAPATEPLVKALKDEEKEVRRQAAQALGRIVAGARPQAGEQRPLIPPVPVDAPPPAFPPVK